MEVDMSEYIMSQAQTVGFTALMKAIGDLTLIAFCYLLHNRE